MFIFWFHGSDSWWKRWWSWYTPGIINLGEVVFIFQSGRCMHSNFCLLSSGDSAANDFSVTDSDLLETSPWGTLDCTTIFWLLCSHQSSCFKISEYSYLVIFLLCGCPENGMAVARKLMLPLQLSIASASTLSNIELIDSVIPSTNFMLSLQAWGFVWFHGCTSLETLLYFVFVWWEDWELVTFWTQTYICLWRILFVIDTDCSIFYV